MNLIFLGLDPGSQGFITAYNPINKEYKFYPMPTEKEGTKKIFSVKGLKNLIFEIKNDFPNFKFIGTIEEVTGRQGWSATNTFNFGYNAGAQRMIFEMLGAEIDMVRPQKWQAVMYQGYTKVKVPSSTGKTMIHDTKATSSIVAQDIGKGIDFRKTTRSTNIDDNKTDSFLMCVYGYREFNKKNK